MKILNSSISLLLITFLVAEANGHEKPSRGLEVDSEGPKGKVMMSPPKQKDKKPKGKAKKVLDPSVDKVPDDEVFDIDALVDKINKGGKRKGKAYNQFKGKTNKELRHFLGELEDESEPPTRAKREVPYQYPPGFSSMTFPESFDVSEKWPLCNVFTQEIQNQGNCGSCWAVAAASVMTDRRCIAWNTTALYRRSAWDLVTCCPECSTGNGCEGGFSIKAYDYYATYGVVSGGDHHTVGTSQAYCLPYPLKPTDPSPSSTPCVSTCQSGFTQRTYANDKRYGDVAYRITYNDDAIKYELMTYGPVSCSVVLYQDFMTYSGGVYYHLEGGYLGGHAMKLVGWGVDPVEGPYWKVANSWGSDWGENGYVRIWRGDDELNIESRQATAATAWD